MHDFSMIHEINFHSSRFVFFFHLLDTTDEAPTPVIVFLLSSVRVIKEEGTVQVTACVYFGHASVSGSG